jgi:hypothetical protein
MLDCISYVVCSWCRREHVSTIDMISSAIMVEGAGISSTCFHDSLYKEARALWALCLLGCLSQLKEVLR